eukprot:Hpha_TRINITY_DN15857_c3_g3::TRINITY_DN15857_c3_g3_i1::g.190620::m.190620
MAYLVHVKYTVKNDLLTKVGKSCNFIQGHSLHSLRKQMVEDAVASFINHADFSAKLQAALPGLDKSKRKDPGHLSYKYKVQTEEGREWVTKGVETDLDVVQIVANKSVVYADVQVTADPAAAEQIKVGLARDENDTHHDKIFKGYTREMMVEALKKDVRGRMSFGPTLRPPEDLWGITVSPGSIQCVCPRPVDMDYKHPTDARPWVLHALRCPTLRRTLSGEYLEAFKRVLGVEQKKNKAKNTAQKRRKHEAQMKRDGLREDALFSFLQCSPPPAVESGGSNQPVAVPKRTRNARADPQSSAPVAKRIRKPESSR